MESFADQIKRLRKEKGVPLRVVAAYLNIDQAILSKIENVKRNATRENVAKLARYYKVNENDLIVSWLSDKLLYEVKNEELALSAFKAAEEKMIYKKTPQLSKEKIIEIIREFLSKDGRVAKAWIFGSFARGDYNANSDIDLMVTYSDKASGTLLDYADIKFYLENLINKKVDLVEEGYVKPFAIKNIEKDKILIYG
ncbi:MAG: nucleotidyltransferase domain-containing protein [Bacteroidales bacterium]|nr:nucleotidyltransferase domain-containing protein [Bacteroidales bacterium]MDP3001528.1 nucleotidyltransferase domain-containing protein [Bacteroidales bacterium]